MIVLWLAISPAPKEQTMLLSKTKAGGSLSQIPSPTSGLFKRTRLLPSLSSDYKDKANGRGSVPNTGLVILHRPWGLGLYMCVEVRFGFLYIMVP